MSDSKLRELERRWRETGSVDDEAAYLRERVRVGDLTQERLELAAYCGHEGARRAAPAFVTFEADRGALAASLRWGKDAAIKLAVTAVQVALEHYGRRQLEPNPARDYLAARRAELGYPPVQRIADSGPPTLLAAVLSYLECPCERCAQACGTPFRECTLSATGVAPPGETYFSGPSAVLALCQAVVPGINLRPDSPFAQADPLASAFREAARGPGVAEVVRRLAMDVAPWALGLVRSEEAH